MGKTAHHEGEDAEVDEEWKQEHTHCATDMVQKRSLLTWVEEHLAEPTKVHCTVSEDKSSDCTRLGIPFSCIEACQTRNKEENVLAGIRELTTHLQIGMRPPAQKWSRGC
jgi:hypothetical protein